MTLTGLLAPLLQPAFTVAGAPTSWAELLGFATGILTVWLVARQHVWNWPIGVANVVLLGLVFMAVGLYADAALQVIYVILGLYGWWQWLYGGAGRTRLTVRRTGRAEWAVLAGSGIVTVAALTFALAAWTDSTVPFWDALTTALSLVATYGQTRKLVESWWLWIAADLVYIPLYAYKGLYLTSALYVIFLALCVSGLLAWRSELTVRRVRVAA
ncbi:nicotinamide riboside transporter PnuC [Streptosporangium sp. NBC_01639]|uniref:nicotinamide riboside transporter PnuC n=1 Tax=unclassified Streptosporangium TaxID=2632669 RepID=UPI002DD8B3E5|nr:nicotinamide riboside transporter PnuC [Streptosporangium sp. NBC_01756]WSC88045.1 nicotinamide riboside transporter PnuC [Streptosporangium sp. NBC_01756]WTD53276.1 nicotinamide riboside transporter PnuC [Streptosporangium sp. NBC_01639]